MLTFTNRSKKIVFLLFLFFFTFIFIHSAVQAQVTPTPSSSDSLPSIPCGCPKGASDEEGAIINQIYNGDCVESYDTWKQNPIKYHYWAKDQEVTTQGKANERARQFIYWALQNNSIDNHPVIFQIWNSVRNLVYFFLILIGAVMGVGMIIAQRSNYDFKIRVWPSIFKLLALLLYITFSAALVLTIIQLSEVLMKFFIENLGGKDIFNIYFSSISKETNYTAFEGCRDLNWKVQESAKTELLLLQITNITYYVMGAMLLLRKIILWFMLFVSPFLAVLMPFVLIRNVGWIWVGVFFQWVFYGPLFALFLGGLAKLWANGIPFPFDFSRVNKAEGYIFPTAINILYGGPAQKLSFLNNGSYIDTFIEYVITILMLWAVTFFPWFLLRIFRDYCCDGIASMKNILMSMYDQMRNSGSPSSPKSPSPSPNFFGATVNTSQQIDIPIKVKLETIEEIKKTKTEDIAKSLNLSASKLTDIAHFETNRQTQQSVRQNIAYLSNPTKAETPAERQKFMNIRTELFNRSLKNDQTAMHVLSSLTTSKIERVQRASEMIKTVNVPQEKISSINLALFNAISQNNNAINNIAQTSQTSQSQVQSVINAVHTNINQPVAQVTQKISEQTNIEKEKVIRIIKSVSQVTKADKEMVKQIAEKENTTSENIEKIIDSQIPVMAEPAKHIEQTISVPPTVSIEEYEEVKKMWIQQYEKGEIPISENIKTREEWLDKDIVFVTNTLNKIMSSEESMRQEGLDDLSYILPIFMINNMKGDELLVYLKAKLEAAKTVQEQRTKEAELKEKLKTEVKEDFVEVARPKTQENAKTMTLEQEIKPEDKKTP